jgi:hypothetical protein
VQALADLAVTDFAAAASPEGMAWMAALPSLLHDLARQWSLTADGDLFWHGYGAVVFPSAGTVGRSHSSWPGQLVRPGVRRPR